MVSKEEVEDYLERLVNKMDLFKVIFEDEDPKDRNTMLKLELSQSACAEYIKKLTYKEYSDGPVTDTVHGGFYWLFGKIIKEEEIYIKINIGFRNKPVIIISFHFSEHKMVFPLR